MSSATRYLVFSRADLGLARRALVASSAVFLAALTVAATARAEGTALRADLVDAKTIKLDGVPREWSGLVPLAHTLRGRNGKPDIEARAQLAYDANSLYVAADVTDDVLRGGDGDRVEVVLGFPGGAAHSVFLYPGDPGRSAGAARGADGAVIAGARVVEAPRSGGWSLEASVPWSAFPPARDVRVGLRGAIFVHDVDVGGAVKNVVGTAPGAAYASLPPLNTEAEQSLYDGLLKDKGLRGAPRWNLVADVAGDAMKERVLVYDRWLVVLGSNFRHGNEYYFGDLGVDGPSVVGCEVRDVTGDGQSEILVRRRFGTPTKYREALQIMRFGASDVPTTIFQHELAVVTDAGAVTNDIAFVTDGGKPAIKITPSAARGFTAATYREPVETSYDAVLLPWGPVASQLYKLSGSAFVKAGEERQAAAAAPAPTPPPAPVAAPEIAPRPPPPSASDLLEKVHDLYKRDRGVSGRPRVDLAVDVAGDGQVERVLLHDRDIVVFGKGFKGGTGYAALTLQMFASSSDVTEMTARDVNGDGKAEIVVKGVVHASRPGGDSVDREVILVFKVEGDAIRRVFSAEIGRAIGKKRVSAIVRFVGGGIELAPGSATEWTQATYPFTQDTAPVGGLEPLLLPWGGAQPTRYRWSNGTFTR
jgi:hypothetical protein